jgi:hypothetical protein
MLVLFLLESFAWTWFFDMLYNVVVIRRQEIESFIKADQALIQNSTLASNARMIEESKGNYRFEIVESFSLRSKMSAEMLRSYVEYLEIWKTLEAFFSTLRETYKLISETLICIFVATSIGFGLRRLSKFPPVLH